MQYTVCCPLCCDDVFGVGCFAVVIFVLAVVFDVAVFVSDVVVVVCGGRGYCSRIVQIVYICYLAVVLLSF